MLINSCGHGQQFNSKLVAYSPSTSSVSKKKSVTFSLGVLTRDAYRDLRDGLVVFANQEANRGYFNLKRDVLDCFELCYSLDDVAALDTPLAIQKFCKNAIEDILFGSSGLFLTTFELLNKSLSEKIYTELEQQFNLSKYEIKSVQKMVLEDIRDQLQQIKCDDELRYRQKVEELLPDVYLLCERLKESNSLSES